MTQEEQLAEQLITILAEYNINYADGDPSAEIQKIFELPDDKKAELKNKVSALIPDDHEILILASAIFDTAGY